MPEAPKAEPQPKKCWFCEHPGEWRIPGDVFKAIDLKLTCGLHLHEAYWVQVDGFMRWATPHYLLNGQVKVDSDSVGQPPRKSFDPSPETIEKGDAFED